MTAKTIEGALAEERSRRTDRDAEIWRRACEAMREAAAARIEEVGRAWSPIASDIRSLPIPEYKP